MKSSTNDNEYDLPKIIFFKASTSAVGNKESFSLYWEVKNATYVEIYKNEILLEKRSAEETSITISESYDGKDKEIEYSLIASNDAVQTKSLPVYVRVTDVVKKQAALPEIISFEASTSIVQNRESFTLTWEVKNATDVDLYRNGMVFRKLNADKTSVTISESYDGKDKDINYILIALNDIEQAESAPVIVTITDKISGNTIKTKALKTDAPVYEDITTRQERYQDRKEKNLKNIRIYLWGVLLAVIVAVIVIVYYFQSQPKILDFDPKTVLEEHTIVIVGKNFPKDSTQLQVIFNKVRGNIQYHSEEIIRVVVPVLGEQIGDGNVTVAVVIKGDTTNASKSLLVRKRLLVEKVPTLVTDSVTAKDTLKIETVKKMPKVPARKNVTPDSSPVKVDPQPPVVITEPKKIIDINKMVKVTSNEFKRKTFGGVKDLELTVQNDSPYDLDNVHVEISYLKKNERKIKNETIVFSAIRAHTTDTKSIDNSNRGAKVTFRIILINSKQLNADLQR